MKKLFGFTKKKKNSPGASDSGSVLSAGYDVKEKDLGKVHKAAWLGDLGKLKQLVKKNDINQLDKENRTPLHIACACGHADVVQFLVDGKAKLNLCDNQNRSALMKAVQGQHDRCVSILLENHAEPNLVDVNGNTALHLAANIPAITTAASLLEHEADVNPPNKEGFTPLTVSVREDHLDMAEFLLKEGAEVNFMDQDRRTPLMIAACNGQINMLRLLLRFHADVELKDTKGWSADDHAVINGHHPCSLLINEHATQRRGGTSLTQQDGRKKGKNTSKNPKAGLMLAGPATDKDDFDDHSQSESLSRVSRSAADEWASSEEEDESLSNEKKPKINLRKMIASKKGEVSPPPDKSLSGTESEPERETRFQRAQSFSSSRALQTPVDPSPVSLPPRPFQMTSTPLPLSRERKDSVDDDVEGDDDDDDDDDVPEDEHSSDNQLEGSRESLGVASVDPQGELCVENRRDFLSELGLETGEKVQQSSDSESDNSRSPRRDERQVGNDSESAAVEVKTKESTLSPAVSNDNHSGSTEAVATIKEKEKAKWEPLLSKREGHKQETDLMNELNLGDCDDLEDASDWDTASNASKTTLPGRRMASPAGGDIPERSKAFIDEEEEEDKEEEEQEEQEEEEDEEEEALPVPQRRSSLDEEVVRTSSPLVPVPQPRARKMLVPDSDESDWDQDNSSSASKTNDQRPTTDVAHLSTDFTKQSSSSEEKRHQHAHQQELEVVQEVRRSSSTNPFIDGTSRVEAAEKHELSSCCQKETSSQAAEKLDSAPSVITATLISQKLRMENEQEVTSRSHLTTTNGNQLNVFEDSSLSDMSDREGSPRIPSGQQKNKGSERLEETEDFDELTQSSDTATDDMDSPAAGYRHASLLIQKLDSATLDCKTIVKLQNIFHEYERSIQIEKRRHGHLSDKVSQLETERVELKKSLEEVKDFKSSLERNQLELKTEVTNLKFQLKQEQENARNATMMFNSTRAKLRRSEEQQQSELQERQTMELTFRNLELDLRTMSNNMKQLEDDHNETQRLLAQERSARTLQEDLLNTHLRKQQEMEAENKRNVGRSSETLSQLTEAGDRERELQQQISCLNEQLSILRTDLERSKANSGLRESHLSEENEALKEQLEDARRDLKLNGDSFFTCNNQLAALKSELSNTATRLENERQARETLVAELESSHTRLLGALQEAERCQATLTHSEKALLKEREEHQRLREKLTGESSGRREEVSSLCQKLGKAEENANKMENEAHRVTMQLSEKNVLLDILQRDKDQISARAKELESSLQSEKEQVGRAAARHEATMERLAQAQSEAMLMRQQLEAAQNRGVAKERAVTDAQERFSDILSKLRSDSEEKVQLVEERNKELASKAADLRDQVYKLEDEKSARATELRQLQQELTDTLKKLSMSEASLEVNSRYRNDLEEEKSRLLKDVERLKAKLEESETQHVQGERRINSLKSRLDDKEKELGNAAHKQQEALSASAASAATIKQLEDAVQRLEIENVKLEAASKQQSNKIEALQREAQEAAVRYSGAQGGSRVKGHLEELVTNLQSSKMTLEEQLNREVQRQGTLSHTAQDSQAMWEEEMKSSSKLGLRLAELEKDKGDLGSQVDIEKKKVKKLSEQKKMSEVRLDQELQRNTDLQKEIFRMKTLLKTAKRKLRDQEVSPMSTFGTDRFSQADVSMGRMKVDELQVQLDRETSQRRELERETRELKDQLASGRMSGASGEQLERSKRKLEDEVLELRRRLDLGKTEQNQMDQYRREIEEKARHELQQKIDQVNRFLQSQAESQEALDQMRSTNEANLRSKYEQRILEMEGELGRARTNQHDSLSQRDFTRTELERFQQLYREEQRLRKSLDAKLERANARLDKANSKLLHERSRSLRLGGASLDVGSVGTVGNYGMSLGHLHRSLGLGLTHLTPTTDGQKNTVDYYLAKMQSELDKSMTRELSDARAELDSASARRTELDPVSRANQEYLEVMKKNYMI